ncbi:hypothetical protein ICE_05350 [Bacillus cereus BAG1X1-2]|uniref:helix-turn-helix domain-containing protein n=1 Tax=Bacillus cereus TaxID=1396 RepID=UPI00027AA046|nr:helix-turn-helix transcriptional regulator [Bacillus cereus]EJS45940.1 hypothetical protein ICE_05350 [Bacillus cereus BAG1X1-2]
MNINLCHGFLYEKEEELRELVGSEEYLDMKFDKGNGDWELAWDDESDANDLPSSLAMDVYCKRKAEGLTQRELAQKLGISLETLSRLRTDMRTYELK